MKPRSCVLFFTTTSALMLCAGIEYVAYATPPQAAITQNAHSNVASDPAHTPASMPAAAPLSAPTLTSAPAPTPASTSAAPTPTARAAAPSAEELENMPLAEINVSKEADDNYYLVIQPPKGEPAAKICERNIYRLRDTIFDYPNYPLLFKGKIYGYKEMLYCGPHGDYLSPFGGWSSSSIHLLGNIKDLDVSNLTSLNSLFYCCDQLRDISGLSAWNTSNVTNMMSLFSNCSQLANIKPLTNWDTSKVTDMSFIFSACAPLSDISPLASWKTGNVESLSYAFAFCPKITDLRPIEKWDTSKVTDMSYMFQQKDPTQSPFSEDERSLLTDISPLAKWNIQRLTTTHQMFSCCTALQSLNPLSNWDVKNIQDLGMMFESCTGLQGTNDLSNWTLKTNANLDRIFQDSGNDDCTIDFSNKVFNDLQDPNYMISQYKGVFIANNWDISQLSEDKRKGIFGQGEGWFPSTYTENLSCLFLTDNDTILDKLKDTGYTTQVTVQQGDQTDSITLPAVYDSRVDDNGEVDKTKSASKDAMKVVQTQFNKALRAQLEKDAAACKSISSSWPGLPCIQSLPKNYVLIPEKQIDPQGSPTQLFKTTYHITETETKPLYAKITYKPSSALAYGTQKVLKAAKNGTQNVALGGMTLAGIWDPDMFTVLNTVSAAQNGITEVGNVEETKTVLKHGITKQDDPTLEKGKTKVITPGKDGETVVKKTHAVDAATGALGTVTDTKKETTAAVDEVIAVGTKEPEPKPKPPVPQPPTPEPPVPAPQPPAPLPQPIVPAPAHETPSLSYYPLPEDYDKPKAQLTPATPATAVPAPASTPTTTAPTPAAKHMLGRPLHKAKPAPALPQTSDPLAAASVLLSVAASFGGLAATVCAITRKRTHIKKNRA